MNNDIYMSIGKIFVWCIKCVLVPVVVMVFGSLLQEKLKVKLKN